MNRVGGASRAMMSDRIACIVYRTERQGLEMHHAFPDLASLSAMSVFWEVNDDVCAI